MIPRPEALQVVDEVFSHRNYIYPFADVAKVVGAAKDATNWRQRKLPPFEPKKIEGRYVCTREGLITLGIMAELAWLIGPENAAVAAREIWVKMFARSPHGMNSADFFDTVIVFKKPGPFSTNVPKTPRFPSDDESEWDRVSGFTMWIQKSSDLDNVPQSTFVVLPIGILTFKWAQGIQMHSKPVGEA